MGANKILRIECDLKGCGKILMIPDPPLKPTVGVEKIWSLTAAASNITYWFCCPSHALAFLVAWIKATPEERQIERPKSVLNDVQLKTLLEMGIIVETGQTIEEIPIIEDLNLNE